MLDFGMFENLDVTSNNYQDVAEYISENKNIIVIIIHH